MVRNNAIWQQNSDINSDLSKPTLLTIYPRPIESKFDQGSEFIGHEFKKFLIEEFIG